LLLCLLLGAGCTGHAASPSSGRDAGGPPSLPDAAQIPAAPVCPELEPLCQTGGYAHFSISNVEGSGLPNEATYVVSRELVTDGITGLVWQRTSSEPMGWDEARQYCDGLVEADRDDFRLPGRIELVTVLDFAQLPVVANVFDAAADYHFSSSVASFVEGSAYSVYFGAGETTIARADPGRARALCVAGEVGTVVEPRFLPEGDTILDSGTGLRWEARSGEASSFEAAQQRCAAKDMRLPSIRELQSIVDERDHDPAMDSDVFPDASSASLWSSSTSQGWPWLVDFTDGTTHADVDPGEARPSRCVR
jgi:hypothetical protein